MRQSGTDQTNISSRRVELAIAVALVVLSALPVRAQDFRAADGIESFSGLEGELLTEVPIEVDGEWLIVPVEARGRSYRFILDTGATTGAITRSLARQLGLQAVGEAKLSGASGLARVPVVTTKLLRLGDVRAGNWEKYVLDDEVLADGDVATPKSSPHETTVVWSLRRRLLADPGYLSEHGTPATLEDLADHILLAWRPPGGGADRLLLRDGGDWAIAPETVSSDDRLLRVMARHGLGIAYVPDPDLPDPEHADLVPVLDDVVDHTVDLLCHVPRALEDVPRVQAIVELVRAAMLAGQP